MYSIKVISSNRTIQVGLNFDEAERLTKKLKRQFPELTFSITKHESVSDNTYNF